MNELETHRFTPSCKPCSGQRLTSKPKSTQYGSRSASTEAEVWGRPGEKSSFSFMPVSRFLLSAWRAAEEHPSGRGAHMQTPGLRLTSWCPRQTHVRPPPMLAIALHEGLGELPVLSQWGSCCSFVLYTWFFN